MNGRTRLTTPGAPLRALRILPLLLLSATGARAAVQDINITACPSDGTPYTIEAVVGPELTEEIGVVTTATKVFWDFLDAPPRPTCSLVLEPLDPPGCSIDPADCPAVCMTYSYTCNGVTIKLPTGSPCSVSRLAKVAVSGTPTTRVSVSFRLLVTNDDEATPGTCSRWYHLVIKPRFDLVMVLDRSGSMSLPSTPTESRWDVLKAAANGFTPMVVSAAEPGSRFGMTLFADSVLPNPFAPSDLILVNAGLARRVSDAMQQTPDGLTAMGAGLKNGMAKMTDTTRPRVVVLFTDGLQNQPPEVNLDGCGFSDGTPIRSACPSTPASPSTVKIVTVGIGSPEADYLATLQNLANNNRGKAIITGNGTSFTGGGCTGDLRFAFDCAIVPALSGSSPQMVASYTGTLSGAVSLPPFDVNEHVAQLLIQLSFNRNFEPAELDQILEGLRVLRNGEDVTDFFEPVIVGDFTNSVLLRLRFGTGATIDTGPSEGSYAVELTPVPDLPASLDYRVLVFADDHRLGMDWRVSPAAPRVGQPFRPTVSLTWLSRPVTDAAVEALILKPGDDLGDLLARDPRTVDPSQAPDAGSPGMQKYLELLEDAAFLDRLVPKEQRVNLTHQGDGVYSAPYDPGDISGVYQVLYLVRADSGFGKVQRQAVQSVYVRFGTIDLAASAVSTTLSDDILFLNFRPRTTTGRFVGPANASAISVTGAGVTVLDITDHQDGSYTLALDGDPGAEVSIGMLGEEIYRGPAVGFGPGGPSSRYAWSLHGGLTDPQSGFASGVSGDLLVEADLEVAFSSRFSLNAVLGQYSFDPDPAIFGGTLYARGYLPAPGFRFFAELGAGLYDPDNLDLSWGLSGGLGVDRALSGSWRGELAVDLFHLFNDGDDLEFLAYKVGIRRTF